MSRRASERSAAPLLAARSGISIASDRAARACRRRRQRVCRRRDNRFHRETDARAHAWFLDAPPDTSWDAPQHSPVRTERPSETLLQDQLAGACTTEMLHRYRRQPPDGRGSALWGASANPAKYIFPGDADGAVSIQLIKPTIQLLTLCVRQPDRLRRRSVTLPEFLPE